MLNISRLLILAVVLAGQASAVPVLWTLDAVLFGEGGIATGSFVYDATTNVFSSVNITITGGTLPGAVANATFTSAAPISDSNSATLLTIASGDPTGTPYLLLDFTHPLTNAGGTISLLLDGPDVALCSSATCILCNPNCSWIGPARRISNGHVLGTQIAPTTPIPSSLILVLSSLFLSAAYFVIRRVRTLNS